MAYIEYPECGRIINTHGCRGGVKIEPWCDSPAVFAALKTVYVKKGSEMVPVRVNRAAVLGGRFVSAELDGVTTMEAADALRGTVLYAKRADLGIKKGALLVAEMIGLPVFDKESGKQHGESEIDAGRCPGLLSALEKLAAPHVGDNECGDGDSHAAG